MSEADTIVARATAAGHAGVAIVRLSGPEAIAIAAEIGRISADRLRHGQLRYARMREATGQLIDRGYLVAMHAPRTFTGEDIAELQLHGSPAVIERAIAACVALGARRAERGEFSRRAFLGGKLDLVQAEALLDLVSARTEAAAELALEHLDGRIGEALSAWRTPIIDALSEVEARLDFSEHEDVGGLPASLRNDLAHAASEMASLAASATAGRLRLDGVRIAMYGAPNAGKSTLFNAMLRADRALVHEQAGTTRDVIEAAGELDGIAVTWVDTAGIRGTEGAVEKAGIERARASAATADVVLFLRDQNAPAADLDDPPAGPAHRRIIPIATKSDLPRHGETIDDAVAVSVLDPASVDQLRAVLGGVVRELTSASVADDLVLTRQRHADALARASESLYRALGAMDEGTPLEYIAADLRDATDAIAEITGEIAPDDVLDAIFARFCIGK